MRFGSLRAAIVLLVGCGPNVAGSSGADDGTGSSGAADGSSTSAGSVGTATTDDDPSSTTAEPTSGDGSSTGGSVALCLRRDPLAELDEASWVHVEDVDGDGIPRVWLTDDQWDPLEELRTVAVNAWSIDDHGLMTLQVSQSVEGSYQRFVDVDGDGRLDLVISDWTRNDASFWLPGTADGTFTETPRPLAWPEAALPFTLRPAWRDANGDGIADVFAFRDERLVFLRGDGDGGFAETGDVALSQPYPEHVAAVSGRTDTLVAIAGNGAIGFGLHDSLDIVEVQPDGSLVSVAQWNDNTVDTFDVVLATDRVGDAGIDVIVLGTESASSNLWMLASDGSGFVRTDLGVSIGDAWAGDFEGSGETSLLVTDRESSQIELWRGAGVPSEDVSVVQGQLGALEVGNFIHAVGDFDADGVTELILRNNDGRWETAQVVPCG